MATVQKKLSLSASEVGERQIAAQKLAVPPSWWMTKELPGLLKATGAFGYQFGRKKRRGRWLKGPAITFFTEHKHDVPAKGGHVQPIPEALMWKDGRRRYTLLTDVMQMERKLVLQAGPVFGPGDGVTFGSEMASIGAAVHTSSGSFVTTAGHLFGDNVVPGTTVQVTSGPVRVAGRVVASVVRCTLDYALLQLPRNVPCDNLFRDRLRVGPVFIPTQNDVPARMLVLDHRGRATPTVCRGVNVSLHLPGGVYRGLITADPVTEATQSGGALISSDNRLWGFVIGLFVGPRGSLSVFAPAQMVFDHAGAALVD